MKFLHYLSHHLQNLADSDTASWVLIYSIASLSLSTSVWLLASLNYFSI